MPLPSVYTPTNTTGEDLVVCPVCGGHTKLLGQNIYCPHCNIIVSANLSDTLKAKVAIIKEQSDVVKGQKTTKKQLPRKLITYTIHTILSLLVIGFLILISIPGYQIIRAKAEEEAGNYQTAAYYYQKSLWPIALPGVTSELNRMMGLEESQRNFFKGKELYEKAEYKQALFYFNLVDPLDSNYQNAQQLKRDAELKQSRI